MFQNNLESAKIILLNKPMLRYYGILMTMFHLETEPYRNQSYLGYIRVKDKKIVLVERPDLDRKDLVGIIVHEILHMLNRHRQRQAGRDSNLWNIATDHTIHVHMNELVDHYGKHISLGPDPVYFPDLDPSLSAEEVYDLLKQEVQNNKSQFQQNQQSSDSSDQSSQSSSTGGDDSGDQQESGASSFIRNGHSYKVHQDLEKFDGADNAETQAIADEFIVRAKTIYNAMKLQGNLPMGITLYLDKVFEVRLPWEELLEHVLRLESVQETDVSWTVKNIYLPGIRMPGEYPLEDQMGLCVFALDTSGSMLGELDKLVGVVASVCEQFKEIYLIEHDVEIQNVIKVGGSITAINKEVIIEELMQMKGGGGTSHRQVFEWIDKKMREETISAAVFLTDAYSDFEEIYKYEFPQFVPTIWVVIGSKMEQNIKEKLSKLPIPPKTITVA